MTDMKQDELTRAEFDEWLAKFTEACPDAVSNDPKLIDAYFKHVRGFGGDAARRALAFKLRCTEQS